MITNDKLTTIITWYRLRKVKIVLIFKDVAAFSSLILERRLCHASVAFFTFEQREKPYTGGGFVVSCTSKNCWKSEPEVEFISSLS